jgi:16S rRNA G1207 methylase RsmC
MDYDKTNIAAVYDSGRSYDPGVMQEWLDHLSALVSKDGVSRIVDLGCGNGVLGIIAASVNPAASLLFCDESHMAIASASENFHAAYAQTRSVEFRVDDCLQGVSSASQDLVLINAIADDLPPVEADEDRLMQIQIGRASCRERV